LTPFLVVTDTKPVNLSNLPTLPVRIVDSRDYKEYVAYGPSKIGGLRRFGQVVSGESLSNFASIVNLLRAALGEFPSQVKVPATTNAAVVSDGSIITAQFIESFSIANAWDRSVAVSRLHRLESTVEAVVTGESLDACINVFMRRIVEEAYHAENVHLKAISDGSVNNGNVQSPTGSQLEVLTSNIHVYFRGSNEDPYVITMDAMRSKREQMTSIMKSAVVDDGEVHLILYLQTPKRLLPAPGGRQHMSLNNEETAGFIAVNRNYNFSFISSLSGTHNTGSGITRCFSTQPFKSLASHIFLNVDELKVLRKVYFDHVSRTTKDIATSNNNNGQKSEQVPTADTGFERCLHQYFMFVSQKVLSSFSAGTSLLFILKRDTTVYCFATVGEVVDAAENMFLLQCLLQPDTGEKSVSSYCTKQITSVLKSQATRLRAIRDAIQSTSEVCSVLQTEISKLLIHLSEDNLDVDALSDAGKILQFQKTFSLFAGVGDAVKEIKHLLLSLLKDSSVMCSELYSVSNLLFCLMARLFTKKGDKVVNVQMSTPTVVSGIDFSPDGPLLTSLNSIPPKLTSLSSQLDELSCVLKACECSIGVRLFVNLFVNDLSSQLVTGLDTVQNNQALKGGRFAGKESNNKSVELTLRAVCAHGLRPNYFVGSAPMCVSELLGFAHFIMQPSPDGKYVSVVRLPIPVDEGNNTGFLSDTAVYYICSQLLCAPNELSELTAVGNIAKFWTELLCWLRQNASMHDSELNTSLTSPSDVFNTSLSALMLSAFHHQNSEELSIGRVSEALAECNDYPHVLNNVNHDDVKIDYLQRNMIITALHEGSFFATTANKRTSPLLSGISCLFRYASLRELANSSTASDTILIGWSFQSLRLRLIRPLKIFDSSESIAISSTSSSTYPKPVKTKPSSSRPASVSCIASYLPYQGISQSLQGLCVFGCDRIVASVGSTLAIYRRVWLLPPIFPQGATNASRNHSSATHGREGGGGGETLGGGVMCQLCCGISSSTALLWGHESLAAIKEGSGLPTGQTSTDVPESIEYQVPIIVEVAVVLTVSHPRYQEHLRAEYARVVTNILKYLCGCSNSSNSWRINEVALVSNGGGTPTIWDGSLLTEGDVDNFIALEAVRHDTLCP
jgi:hypothetical protein